MQTMNEAQEDALNRAYVTLGEHFENAVVLLSWDVDGTPTEAMGNKLLFKGGSMAALGLMTWGIDRVLDQDRKGRED